MTNTDQPLLFQLFKNKYSIAIARLDLKTKNLNPNMEALLFETIESIDTAAVTFCDTGRFKKRSIILLLNY